MLPRIDINLTGNRGAGCPSAGEVAENIEEEST